MMSILENLAFLFFLMAICFVIYRSVRYDDKAGEGKPRKFALHRKKQPEPDQSGTGEGPAA